VRYSLSECPEWNCLSNADGVVKIQLNHATKYTIFFWPRRSSCIRILPNIAPRVPQRRHNSYLSPHRSRTLGSSKVVLLGFGPFFRCPQEALSRDFQDVQQQSFWLAYDDEDFKSLSVKTAGGKRLILMSRSSSKRQSRSVACPGAMGRRQRLVGDARQL